MTTTTITLPQAPTNAAPGSPATPNPNEVQVQPIRAADFMVDGVHCGGCMRKIERAVGELPGVERVRFNLTTRRLSVVGSVGIEDRVIETLGRLGYPARAYDRKALGSTDDAAEKQLMRAMTVAGFAAANVMLLSVSVWAGTDMGPATRALLHWFSALIVLPAVVYAGRPFFKSALQAVACARTNMDVPISLAILLASGMSLFETVRGGEHVYFESAVMLLFFLLIGRYLDRRARGKARHAAERLLTLDQGSITVIERDVDGGADSRLRTVPVAEAAIGMRVLVAAGERIGVDGKVVGGRSEVDASLITGEAEPAPLTMGDQVFAGTINVAAPIELEITAIGEGTLLAEIVRMMETAEQRRGRYVVLADRIASWYAPVVHGLALATFLGWTLLAGAAWQTALLYAISVLIITCPCALGLAVPAVQVIASGRLLRQGVLLKSGTALERLARIDTVVFDKTGTLTEGWPTLRRSQAIGPSDLRMAASLAAASRHPLARSVAAAAPEVPAASGAEEVPGMGLRLDTPEGEVRLGRREWCGVEPEGDDEPGLELWLAGNGRCVRFAFDDHLRSDAPAVIADLARQGFGTAILSGDRKSTVEAVASRLGVENWRAGCTPADKVRRLEQLAAEGRRVLMVGDGLNDAAALAAAHVSLSPASGVDISQAAADAVFQGGRLAPVTLAIDVARRASRLVRQNLGLALAYNAITIPLAVAGMVTPLLAAVCMSASSLIVVGNALRLGGGGRLVRGGVT